METLDRLVLIVGKGTGSQIEKHVINIALKVQMLEGCFRDRLLGIRTDPWQRLGPYEPSLRPQMKVSTRCVLDSSKLHQ